MEESRPRASTALMMDEIDRAPTRKYTDGTPEDFCHERASAGQEGTMLSISSNVHAQSIDRRSVSVKRKIPRRAKKLWSHPVSRASITT